MTDWLDPQNWLRQIPDPLNVLGFFQDSTRAWLNEFARIARNRPVEIHRGSAHIQGTISSLRLYPKASPGPMMSPDAGFDALERATVRLRDVTWNGREIDSVSVVVEDVRVSQLPQPRITGGPVTLQARIPLRTLADWLAEARIELLGTASAADQHLTVHYRWWRFAFEARVVPGATADAAVFAIRELRVRGRTVPLPSRFDLSLSVGIDLAEGVRLRDAELVDPDTVAVEVQVRSVEYPISLQQIFDRLAAGGERSVFDLDR